MNRGANAAPGSRRRRDSASGRRPPSPSSRIARDGIVALALLALALGGATELWEQASLLFLAALLMLVDPPRASRGFIPLLLAAALLLLAVTAFLPADWFPRPAWRRQLAMNPTVVLPPFRTPQPWLTGQACALLFAGLAWAAYLIGQAWDEHSRRRAAQTLVGGVAALAALMVAAYCLGFHVPTWNQQENRGWFPNKNQTADVLAVCGVVNYALLFGALRRRRVIAYLWIATILALGGALIVAFSRAGIVMFFGGIALWHLWPVRGAAPGRAARSVKWTTLSLALLLVLLTGFFLLGGNTLAKFEGQGRSVEDADFRLAIQHDALRFSLEEPVLGIGLGNFEALFASAQHDSANESRALHPESDWLWALCELGWIAPVLFLAAIAWWLRRCLPFRDEPGESLRCATFVAALLFLLHGLVDVSGHRLGSLAVGLLLIGLALPKPAPVTRAGILPDRGQAWLFHSLALGLLALSGWWFASVAGAPVPPTTADLARIENGIDRAIAGRRLDTALKLADAGLRLAPVNWHLYFQRAYAEAFLPGKFAQAGPDFLAARQLEARWVAPCYDEGAVWVAANEPDLCLDAWSEALRRAQPAEQPALYKDMLELGRNQATVRGGLIAIAQGRPELQIIFLDDATPAETKLIVGQIIAADPRLQRLTPPERERFFRNWWVQGDHTDFLAQLAVHPGWLDTAWPYLAQSYADEKNFQMAWQTVARYAPPPATPHPATNLPRGDLEQAFRDGDNTAAGVLLYLAESRQGETDNALGTLRTLEKLKDCPRYIFYEEARLWASKQDWELAWEAWESFRRG
jgi:hypothetical protein